MKQALLIYIVSILFTSVVVAQTSVDTIFFKNGETIYGQLLDQPFGKAVKFDARDQGVQIYSLNDILRIGSVRKNEVCKEIIYLKTGEVLTGDVQEKTYNKFVKIRVDALGILTIPDNEIDSIRSTTDQTSIEKLVTLKNGNVFKGCIVEKTADSSIKLKTNNLGILSLNKADIVQIKDIPNEETGTPSKLYLKNGNVIDGNIIERKGFYTSIYNKKYGVLTYDLNEIQQIESINNRTNPRTNYTGSDQVINFHKMQDSFAALKSEVNVYNINVLLQTGIVFSENIYNTSQTGISVQLYKNNKLYFTPEVKMGLATNFEYNNTTLNITPILFRYNLQPKIDIGGGIDVYIRMYEQGSTTKAGLLLIANYEISKKVSVGIRTAFYNHSFCGINCEYNLFHNN